jgi:hypothetical protein
VWTGRDVRMRVTIGYRCKLWPDNCAIHSACAHVAATHRLCITQPYVLGSHSLLRVTQTRPVHTSDAAGNRRCMCYQSDGRTFRPVCSVCTATATPLRRARVNSTLHGGYVCFEALFLSQPYKSMQRGNESGIEMLQ